MKTSFVFTDPLGVLYVGACHPLEYFAVSTSNSICRDSQCRHWGPRRGTEIQATGLSVNRTPT
jgi:hypothetical protein